MTHILFQADHRRNRVRAWANQLQDTLAPFLPAPLRLTDLTDDHLADRLRILSDDLRGSAFAGTFTDHMNLLPTTVRVDSTTASGYWGATDDGLFQFGHRTYQRPDLSYGKVMLATLDPLDMPVVADMAAGRRADDRWYVPIIARVGVNLGQTSLWSMGASKRRVLRHRTTGNHSLCPLGVFQLPAVDLAALVVISWRLYLWCR